MTDTSPIMEALYRDELEALYRDELEALYRDELEALYRDELLKLDAPISGQNHGMEWLGQDIRPLPEPRATPGMTALIATTVAFNAALAERYASRTCTREAEIPVERTE